MLTPRPPALQVRYFITDHLGSVRLVADAAGNVLERNDFLPFGEKGQNNGLVSAENPYLYGGKELQTFFGIDWYDSGARFQKTDGTFSSLDPMAESYYPISPYVYCAGDPVMFVDPAGLAVYRDTEGNVLYRNELEEEGGNKYVDGNGRVWWRQEGSVSGAVGKYRYTFNPHGVYLSPAYTTATYLQESEETDEAFNQRMRSLAASIHGTALGVMGHQVYQPGVKWLGKKYTGSRNAFARSLSKGLKVGGFIWNGLSIGLELFQIKQSSDTREQINHFINAGMGMIGFASGYGPFISVGWSLFGDGYYNFILDYYITPQIESGGLYEPLVSY